MGHRFDPWARKIPWGRKWQPTIVFLPRKSMDRGVHGVAKEMDTTSRLNNKINQDGVKEVARGQYLVRQELEKEREGGGSPRKRWGAQPEAGEISVLLAPSSLRGG